MEFGVDVVAGDGAIVDVGIEAVVRGAVVVEAVVVEPEGGSQHEVDRRGELGLGEDLGHGDASFASPPQHDNTGPDH